MKFLLLIIDNKSMYIYIYIYIYQSDIDTLIYYQLSIIKISITIAFVDNNNNKHTSANWIACTSGMISTAMSASPLEREIIR